MHRTFTEADQTAPRRQLSKSLRCGLNGAIFCVALAGCAGTPGAACLERSGQCFAAKVNGLAVQPLSDRTALDALLSTPDPVLRHDLEQVKWSLAAPANKKLDVRTATLPDGLSWFGTGEAQLDVKIVPLSGQVLQGTKKKKRVGSVRSGGKPVIASADELSEERLPAGLYLLIVTLRTDRNWDRKYVLLTLS